VAAPWQHVIPILVALADLDHEEAIEALAAVQRMVHAQRRRGGDPHAVRRRELHDGLRGMASLLGLGKGKPAAEVAREITDRCKRYQPMPVETDPLRREMLRVRSTGLPIPASERHMIRVISDIQ